jgi:hypothetical protein
MRREPLVDKTAASESVPAGIAGTVRMKAIGATIIPIKTLASSSCAKRFGAGSPEPRCCGVIQDGRLDPATASYLRTREGVLDLIKRHWHGREILVDIEFDGDAVIVC